MDSEEWVNVLSLFEYWDTHPPLHLFIPAALGHKSEKRQDTLPDGRKLDDTFFGKAKKKAPAYLRESNPERERRFAKLEEMKQNGGSKRGA